MPRFWFPEQLGGSGVLATVAAGLFVSWNGPLLISAATRLQGIFVWDLMVYLLEGLVFLLTGLQTRTCSSGCHEVPLQRSGVGDRCSTVAVVDGGAFHLGVSGHLSAALAEPVAGAARSLAAVAMGLSPWLRRRARRGFAGRGAGHSADDGIAARRFPTAISSCSSPSASSSSRWSARVWRCRRVVRWLGLGTMPTTNAEREHDAEITARLEA